MRHFVKSGLSLCVSLVALTACSNANKTGVDNTKDALKRIEAAVETAKSTQGPGQPAMWTLADDDTTVYLFGTVHLLPDDLVWKSQSFQTAFDAADKLYLELDLESPEAQEEMQNLILQHATFTDGTTLSSLLTEDQKAAISKAANTVGVPMAALEPVKPWFAGLQLGLVQIMKSGYNPESGVEQVLMGEAAASGKTFGYFESALDQVLILSGASLDEQVNNLVFTAKTIDSGKEILDVIVDEWADGDVRGMSAMMGEPDMFGSQKAYDDLIVNRNQKWIPQIEAILDDPGVKFVAVGAAHLAGPDSVIKMLRQKGYDVALAQ